MLDSKGLEQTVQKAEIQVLTKELEDKDSMIASVSIFHITSP